MEAVFRSALEHVVSRYSIPQVMYEKELYEIYKSRIPWRTDNVVDVYWEVEEEMTCIEIYYKLLARGIRVHYNELRRVALEVMNGSYDVDDIVDVIETDKRDLEAYNEILQE